MELAVTSAGKLTLDGAEQDTGKILLSLLNSAGMPESSAGFVFLRRAARAFMLRLCRHRHEPVETALAAALPEEPEIAELLFDRPPFAGGEHLNAELLRKWYGDLAAAIRRARWLTQLPLAEWIATVDPAWDRVGRVAFHLAPNPNDTAGTQPFLFLATFIHKLAESGEPKHLPLGNAVQVFAKDRDTLLRILAPIRKASEDVPLLKTLSGDGRIYQATPFSARESYDFLQALAVFEAAGIQVRFAKLWKKRPRKLELKISLDIGAKSSQLASWALLRFSPEAAVGDRKLSEEELAGLAAAGGGLIRIKGEWVEADPQRVSEMLRFWQKKREGLTLAQGLRMLAGVPVPELPGFDRAEAVGELAQRIAGKNLPPMPELPENLREILRPYQRCGVEFLWRLTSLGLGAVLADDMGLGKTLQLLSCLELLRIQGELRDLPALLIAPASLLRNWKCEAEKFTPELKFKILHNSELSDVEKTALRTDRVAFLKQFDAVAVTYAYLLKNDLFSGLKLPLAVADEAQTIKNPASRQSRIVRSLPAVRRIALSGTPVENRLTDLWSIFDFTNPGLLGTLEEFKETAEALDGHYAPLRKLTSPYLLRRLKTDKSVIADLPDKSELRTFVQLSSLQAALYRAALEEMRVELTGENENDSKRNGIVLKYLMRFKQICNHPAQFTGKPDWRPELSGKFQRLAELLYPIAAKQEKVLIFTQFREMIEPLHEFVSRIFGRTGAVLHGGTPVGARPALVDSFQAPDGEPFFILSLKAAGTGLNLTAASHVIHFDRWWNPAAEDQATDRAYRIGQHRNVLVHKMVCLGTVEERIDRLIREKQSLTDELTAAGTENRICRMNNAQLLDFVKLDWSNINALRG